MPNRAERGEAESRRRARADLCAIFAAGLRAVDPYALVARRLARAGARLEIELTSGVCRLDPSRLRVFAVGKAAVAMALAVAEIVPNVPGLVVAPGRPSVVPAPACALRWIEAEHPLPGRGSFRAGRLALREFGQADPAQTILVLLSGGASSLLEAPAPGLSTADLRRSHEILLTAGLPIAVMNRFRSALSAIKGGGLLAVARSRRVITLALSDVPGDAPATIGSGPTVAPRGHVVDEAFFEAGNGLRSGREVWQPGKLGEGGLIDARSASAAQAFLQKLPRRVREFLAGDPGRARLALARRPGAAPSLRIRHEYVVIGSNRDALTAAAAEARQRGYAVRRRRGLLSGEAVVAGGAFGRRLGVASRDEPQCVLAGGETTVRIEGRSGLGGRNQEFALAAARAARGQGWAILAAGTDGCDGSTPAAGAICDDAVLARIGVPRLDNALRRHDVYPLLKRSGALVETGPTGTNVMDLAVAVATR